MTTTLRPLASVFSWKAGKWISLAGAGPGGVAHGGRFVLNGLAAEDETRDELVLDLRELVGGDGLVPQEVHRGLQLLLGVLRLLPGLQDGKEEEHSGIFEQHRLAARLE